MKIFFLKNKLVNQIKKLFFPFYRSKEIVKIFKLLENGQEKNKKVAMFVGGCVRNHLLGKDIDDIDIATVFTPEEIKEKFKNSEVKVLETGLKHGSVTLLINKSKFEITTLRQDVKSYGRHADVDFTEDWNIDSTRRDFTINSIYLDKKGNIFDPQNGVQDLKNGRIKFIGDPEKRIKEDYLRIIRFIRFSLQYNDLNLDHRTLEAIKLNLNGIKNLSKERILNELFKIFSLNNFENIIKQEQLKNIFLVIFPEFKFLERLNKINFLENYRILKLEIDLILAILLINESNNFEYFSHKYKTSNDLKNKLIFFAENYKKYKSDKNYFKKNLKKNIYFFGKEKVKKFATFIFFEDKKLSFKEFLKTIDNIDNTSVPKFPYDGQFLINKGMSEGKKLGKALRELEEVWVNNNYSISEKNLHAVINKVKKSDVFDI